MNDNAWKNSENGQALLEFALLIPLLLALLFGIFTVGWWMNAQQIVTQSAYIGARQGAITNDNTVIISAVMDNMRPIGRGFSSANIEIEPKEENDPNRRWGKPLTLTLRYRMPRFFPGIPAAFDMVTGRVSTMIECFPNQGEVICKKN